MAEEDIDNSEIQEGELLEEGGSTMTTTLVTGAALAIFAPELLPGMAIGVAAMLAPRLLPSLAVALRPLVKTAVRAGYAAAATTRELAAEAGEQVQDMVAEARAEQENGKPVRTTQRTRAASKRRRAHA